MSCHQVPQDHHILKKDDKILLMGNPNVGKSVFFSELTGIQAISSNYAGTTVTFMAGTTKIGGESYTLIDVPGTYSLQPTSEAEAVAARFMESGAKAIICVLDATNLERNLRLALEIKEYGLPTVYALNLWDVGIRRGILVNQQLLASALGAPVIPTIAVKREGLPEMLLTLETSIKNADKKSGLDCGLCSSCGSCPGQMASKGPIPEQAKEIARRVISYRDIAPSFLDKLGEAFLKPMPGIFLAILVMALSIGVIVGGGRGLRALIFLPLVNGAIVPFVRSIFSAILPLGFFQNLLIGEFGIFVISFEWIVALIFPYVLLFYLVFTFLEDTGFLPQMSVLFDNVMRKLGVQGGSLIHVLMGYGCAVPAIIGTRAATTKKERLIVSAAICFAIPCISQTGALISLLAGYSWWLLPAMVLFAFFLFVAISLIAGRLIKGEVEPLMIEIPNLLMPNPRSFGRKLTIRMRHFLKDAEVPMMIAIVLAAVLSESGILAVAAEVAEPLVTQWLGLPSEAVMALILGIVRREMSVAPLLALNLTPLQAFVGGVVSLLYLPCLSVFAILAKEFKVKVAVIISVSTVVLALFMGGLINQIGQLFS